MSDSDPVHPRGAWLIGHALVGVGWLIIALAFGIVVLEIALHAVRATGIVAAIILAFAGGTALAVGHGIQRSRLPEPEPTNDG